MKETRNLTLAFAILFAVFFIGPALLSKQFGPFPLMKVGDVFDLLTPLVLIAFYWLLYRADRDKPATLGQGLTFLAMAALWVQGQGMHLAANSIGHLVKGMEETDIYALTFFYDEVLSHYLWHIGVMGFSGLVVYQQWRHSLAGNRSPLGLPIIAAVIYGLTFFMIIVEGGTALLGVPFAVLVALLGLIRGRERIREQPLLAFFVIGYLVASILFAGWGIYWRGLPQFSQVGIIE